MRIVKTTKDICTRYGTGRGKVYNRVAHATIENLLIRWPCRRQSSFSIGQFGEVMKGRAAVLNVYRRKGSFCRWREECMQASGRHGQGGRGGGIDGGTQAGT